VFVKYTLVTLYRNPQFLPFAISDGGTGGCFDVYNIPRRVSVIYIGHLFSFIKHRQPGETLSKRSQGRFLISRLFLKGIFVYANRGRAALILAEKITVYYVSRISEPPVSGFRNLISLSKRHISPSESEIK